MIVFEKTSLHNTFVMTYKRYHITMSHNIFTMLNHGSEPLIIRLTLLSNGK